jgi:hypothetical protein
MTEIQPSVVYRTGPLTLADYNEAIEALQDAKQQMEPDGENCRVCGDSGHQAWQCHHNPLVMARRAAKSQTEWRCFHCGDVFTDEQAATEHFGRTSDDGPAACIGTKHPLVVRLRERVKELERKLAEVYLEEDR